MKKVLSVMRLAERKKFAIQKAFKLCLWHWYYRFFYQKLDSNCANSRIFLSFRTTSSETTFEKSLSCPQATSKFACVHFAKKKSLKFFSTFMAKVRDICKPFCRWNVWELLSRPLKIILCHSSHVWVGVFQYAIFEINEGNEVTAALDS